MINPKLSDVVAQLHTAREALKSQGIIARFDLEITDKGPRVYANVSQGLFQAAQKALPSHLEFATVRVK